MGCRSTKVRQAPPEDSTFPSRTSLAPATGSASNRNPPKLGPARAGPSKAPSLSNLAGSGSKAKLKAVAGPSKRPPKAPSKTNVTPSKGKVGGPTISKNDQGPSMGPTGPPQKSQAKPGKPEKPKKKTWKEKLEEHHLMRDVSVIRNMRAPVFCFIGAPRCGKSAVCKRLARQYQMCHVDIKDVLYYEVMHEEWTGERLQRLRDGSHLIPMQLLLAATFNYMLNNVRFCRGFLMDGFPHTREQAIEFEKRVARIEGIFFFKLSHKVAKRLVETTDHLLPTVGTHTPEDINTERLRSYRRFTTPLLAEYAPRIRMINTKQPTEPTVLELMDFFDAYFRARGITVPKRLDKNTDEEDGPPPD